jgi:hypothetical protein
MFRRRGFLFLPLQTNWIMDRLDLEPGAPLEEMRVLTADGRNIGGADAVVFLARQIWWAWPFAALAQSPPMHKLLDQGYRWITARRDCDHITCNLPPRKRCPGWVALMVLPLLALLARNHVAPWQFMWLMAGAIFLGCKWLTFWGVRRQIQPVRVGRALAYFFLWPGMDAKKFACPTDRQNLTALNRQVLRKPASEVRESRDPRWVSRAAKQLSGNLPSHAGGCLRSPLSAGASSLRLRKFFSEPFSCLDSPASPLTSLNGLDWNDRDDSGFAFWNLRSARNCLASLRTRRATNHGRAA